MPLDLSTQYAAIRAKKITIIHASWSARKTMDVARNRDTRIPTIIRIMFMGNPHFGYE
jgi:hypothetical protein